MGTSLTRAAQWTAGTGPSKLETSPINRALLKEVLLFVEQFNTRHPSKVDLEFKQPLRWKTTLEASDFTSEYDISGETIQALETGSEGQPLLVFSPPTLSVQSFSQLSKLAQMATEKMLKEATACLEENRDILEKILGPGVTEDKDNRTEQNSQMLLLLQQLDELLLNTSLQHVSLELGPCATVFNCEVETLQCLCSEETRLLKSVNFTSAYEFSNGCHAPPWRQEQGEVCYLVIEPYDTEALFITCSTSGVFLSDGHIKHKGEESSCRQKCETYKDLVSLLKSKSPYFAKNINKQESESMQGVSKQLGKKPLELSSRWKNLGLTSFQHMTPTEVEVSTEDFSESSSDSEEEEEEWLESNVEQPPEFWQIHKLAKYLKRGDQTATVLALCALREFMDQDTSQLAIRDVGALEVLINLLETQDTRCKIESLKILRNISQNSQIRRSIADHGGLQSMVKILDSPVRDLRAVAAETIANVARFHRARRTVRQHGGIKRLVALLVCASNGQLQEMEEARCGALALWSCSHSRRNKEAIRQAGGVPLLACLLKSPHQAILIPVVGILQECCSEMCYRTAVHNEGMVEDLVRNLSCVSQELQMLCASAIFKCAEDSHTRDLVRYFQGLKPLVSLLDRMDNKPLLAAATGAVWKCSLSLENVEKFQEYGALSALVRLLSDQPEEVLVNVVGALGESAQLPANRTAIRQAGGLRPLVRLLSGTTQGLLVNVTRAIGACATDLESMKIIDGLDGVRLLCSLLKNPSPNVQASAAWALCPCIEKAKDAGGMVHGFVGALELMVGLLKSTNRNVLASVCAVIAKIAKDETNLAVLTDHGVVPMIAQLTNTTDNRLRFHLAEAVTRCCLWGENRKSFGEAGAVPPLVRYLRSCDESVHHPTAQALHQLSRHPDNCISMHENGVVRLLLPMIGSSNQLLQEAAAGCVCNIRRLALANQKL